MRLIYLAALIAVTVTVFAFLVGFKRLLGGAWPDSAQWPHPPDASAQTDDTPPLPNIPAPGVSRRCRPNPHGEAVPCGQTRPARQPRDWTPALT